MRAYTSMPTSEFVAQLRDIAINAGARPLIIDQIDNIVEGPTEDEVEDRIEEAEAESEKFGFQAGKEDMWADISNMLTDMEGDEATLKRLFELLKELKP